MENFNLYPLAEKTRIVLESLGVASHSRILIGVSGGPDSMAILHVLASLKESGAIGELWIAHVNHGLRRDASDRDEALVRETASKLNIPIEVHHADTFAISQLERTGIEETARKIRYDFFAELAAKQHFDFIVTAHTANDQAETVLMNMVRGTGVAGLAGIPAKRKIKFPTPFERGGQEVVMVIRPWLDVTRQEIVEYLAEHNIESAHDASNEELIYQRNRVRHLVIPALEEAYPDRDPLHAIAGLARRMSELNRFLSSLAEETLETILQPDGSIALPGLRDLRGYLLHAVLGAWLRRSPINYGLSDREFHTIERFIFSDANNLSLRHGIALCKNETILYIQRSTNNNWTALQLRAEESCETPSGKIIASIREENTFDRNPNHAAFDAKQLMDESFLIRPWQEGDRMAPFGMHGKTKLVSDILNESGFSARQKRGYPVVARASNPDDILWIPGIRRAEVAKITEETKCVVIFEWVRKSIPP
ncbi:MAG TPA: tRNA lysidine(34) synthetase TilS [Candidatus Kapabacteria bacterium]|nr:tRNA lysidine(34) synthetase TilS [Candidatus Kapabacteria bacterium]